MDIPELKNEKCERLVRDGVHNHPSREIIDEICHFGDRICNCAVVITQLLDIIDQYASHSLLVYRALFILDCCLQSSNKDVFAQVARYFAPEIQTIMYLSFQGDSLYREKVHHIVTEIYGCMICDIQVFARNPYTDFDALELPDKPKSPDFNITPVEDYRSIQALAMLEITEIKSLCYDDDMESI